MSLKHLVAELFLGLAIVSGSALADSKPAEKAPPKARPAKVAVVDINTATQQQLEAIPEIGKEHCHHIIMGRPYADKEELATRNILPKETYEKVKHKVTVAKATPKPKP